LYFGSGEKSGVGIIRGGGHIRGEDAVDREKEMKGFPKKSVKKTKKEAGGGISLHKREEKRKGQQVTTGGYQEMFYLFQVYGKK